MPFNIHSAFIQCVHIQWWSVEKWNELKKNYQVNTRKYLFFSFHFWSNIFMRYALKRFAQTNKDLETKKLTHSNSILLVFLRMRWKWMEAMQNRRKGHENKFIFRYAPNVYIPGILTPLTLLPSSTSLSSDIQFVHIARAHTFLE